jgi:hypothetical protein
VLLKEVNFERKQENMNADSGKKKRRVRKHPRGAKGVPKTINLLRKSPHMQRWFLKNPWMKPMLCFNLAVIKMQVNNSERVTHTQTQHSNNQSKYKSICNFLQVKQGLH